METTFNQDNKHCVIVTAACQHHLTHGITGNFKLPESGSFSSSLCLGFGIIGLSRPETIDYFLVVKCSTMKYNPVLPVTFKFLRKTINQLHYLFCQLNNILKIMHHDQVRILC